MFTQVVRLPVHRQSLLLFDTTLFADVWLAAVDVRWKSAGCSLSTDAEQHQN